MPANPVRSSRGFNTDLAGNEAGVAVRNGDWVELTGVDNAVTAFVRELTTPNGAAGRFNLDASGLQMLDEVYGNPGYQLLGENMTEITIDEHIKCIEEVMRNHPRLLFPDGAKFDFRTIGNQVMGVFTLRVIPYGLEEDINLLLMPYENGFVVGREEAS